MSKYNYICVGLKHYTALQLYVKPLGMQVQLHQCKLLHS